MKAMGRFALWALMVALCGCTTLNVYGGPNPDEGRSFLNSVTVEPVGNDRLTAGGRALITVDYIAYVSPITLTLQFSDGVTPAAQTLILGTQQAGSGPPYKSNAPNPVTHEFQLDDFTDLPEKEITVSVTLVDGHGVGSWYSPTTSSFVVYAD
jgi:hypothetical protein